MITRSLLERVQIVQSEWRYQSRDLAEEDSSREDKLDKDLNPPPDLSLRETQVLNLLTQGLSNIEIGNQLHLSSRTVEKYVSSLLRKTQTNNRAELVRFALEHHLVK